MKKNKYYKDYWGKPIRCCCCKKIILCKEGDGFDSSHDRKNSSYCEACVLKLEKVYYA